MVSKIPNIGAICRQLFNENYVFISLGIVGIIFSVFITSEVLRKAFHESAPTPLNRLIILDCILKLKTAAKIPFRIGFLSLPLTSFCAFQATFDYFTNFSDRIISVSIATYRYTLVNHSEKVMTKQQRTKFQKWLFGVMICLVLVLGICAFIYRQDTEIWHS